MRDHVVSVTPLVGCDPGGTGALDCFFDLQPCDGLQHGPAHAHGRITDTAGAGTCGPCHGSAIAAKMIVIPVLFVPEFVPPLQSGRLTF